MLTNLIGISANVPFPPSGGKPGGSFKAEICAVFTAEVSTSASYKHSDRQDHTIERTHDVFAMVFTGDGVFSGPHRLSTLSLD